MTNKIIINIQCDGCMAEDHRIKQIGQVIDIQKAHQIWSIDCGHNSDYDYYVCEVLNSHLDDPKKYFYCCVQDSSVQKCPVNSNVLFWYT